MYSPSRVCAFMTKLVELTRKLEYIPGPSISQGWKFLKLQPCTYSLIIVYFCASLHHLSLCSISVLSSASKSPLTPPRSWPSSPSPFPRPPPSATPWWPRPPPPPRPPPGSGSRPAAGGRDSGREGRNRRGRGEESNSNSSFDFSPAKRGYLRYWN